MACHADTIRMEADEFNDVLSADTEAGASRVWAETLRPVALVVLVIVLAVTSVRGEGWVPLVSHVDLGIHEFGHLLAMWLPRLATALAGSLLQLLAPAALAAYFWFARRDLPAATVLVAWLGVSLRNVSVYMADANARILPLFGGQDGHDWAFIFGQWHVLDSAERIAGFVSALGFIAFVVALGLALWEFAKPRLDAHRDADRRAHLESLPVREPRNHPPVA